MSNVLDDDKQQQILRAGATGLVASAHRAGDRRPPRDDQRLSESRRHRGARPRPARANQKQNRPFPRRCPPTSGQNRPLRRGGVHRPRASATAGPRAERERLRAVSRADRRGARRVGATPWRSGRTWSTTTAFPRGYASVRRFVVAPARQRAAGGARRHHDGARRRRPGRLRRRADGPRSAAPASTGARGSSS